MCRMKLLSFGLLPHGVLADEIYRETLCSDFGAPVLSARVALGALLIKERLGLTDRETVEAIRENPYLQFFIGNEEFERKPPFDASLMVGFRKRFGEEGFSRISEAIALAALQEAETDSEPTDSEPTDDETPHGNAAAPPTDEDTPQTSSSDHSMNRRQLIVDATLPA